MSVNVFVAACGQTKQKGSFLGDTQHFSAAVRRDAVYSFHALISDASMYILDEIKNLRAGAEPILVKKWGL